MLGGEAWTPEQSQLTEVARTSLIVNLLTEDNLPSYHHEIATMFGRDGAWGTWVHRWTAEEGRHGTAIRDYLLATRAVDPIALERARMTHMAAGYANAYGDDTLLHGIAYVSFQELATRVSHRNTGGSAAIRSATQLLARIAADENLHMIFYRNLLGAAFELGARTRHAGDLLTWLRPSRCPGHGIENFGRKSVQIAMAGVYDLRIHHDEVILPVLRTLKVLETHGLARRRPQGPRRAWRLPGRARLVREPFRRASRGSTGQSRRPRVCLTRQSRRPRVGPDARRLPGAVHRFKAAPVLLRVGSTSRRGCPPRTGGHQAARRWSDYRHRRGPRGCPAAHGCPP